MSLGASSSDRPMAAVALSLITRHGKPVYVKAFEGDNALKFHFIMHAALDYFAEKQITEKSRQVALEWHSRGRDRMVAAAGGAAVVLLVTAAAVVEAVALQRRQWWWWWW